MFRLFRTFWPIANAPRDATRLSQECEAYVRRKAKERDMNDRAAIPHCALCFSALEAPTLYSDAHAHRPYFHPPRGCHLDGTNPNREDIVYPRGQWATRTDNGGLICRECGDRLYREEGDVYMHPIGRCERSGAAVHYPGSAAEVVADIIKETNAFFSDTDIRDEGIETASADLSDFVRAAEESVKERNPLLDDLPDGNPKTAEGAKKDPIHYTPLFALEGVGRVMRGGAEKYGAFNWRDDDITASTYLDAVWRHVFVEWWERRSDADEDSGEHPLDHAIASLLILRDAMNQSCLNDDRPGPRRAERSGLFDGPRSAVPYGVWRTMYEARSETMDKEDADEQ